MKQVSNTLTSVELKALEELYKDFLIFSNRANCLRKKNKFKVALAYEITADKILNEYFTAIDILLKDTE